MNADKQLDPGAVSPLLNARRLRVYPCIFIAAYVLLTAMWIVRATDMIDPSGQVLGADFMAFWSASELAADGRFADAYDPQQLFQASQRAVPDNQSRFIFSYPPVYGLFIAPFGHMDYRLAWALWSLAGIAAFAFVIVQIAPPAFRWWLTLALPALYLNVIQGQNGLFTAALFGGAVMCLVKRPILAGVLIGLLTVKPTLGVLLPIALLFARQWTAFLAAAVTTVALVLLSVAAFGLQPWVAFLDNASFASAMLEDGHLPWAKMPSVFVAMRMLSADVIVAYAVQAVVGGLVAFLVARTFLAWPQNWPLAGALLISGALLTAPHLNNHDLALLTVPLALLIADAARKPWAAWEQALLGFAWLAPLVMAQIAEISQIQVGVIAPAATFLAAARRLADMRPSTAPAHAPA